MIVTTLCNRFSECCRTQVVESAFPHLKALSLQSYCLRTFMRKCYRGVTGIVAHHKD